jgi:hypothetical protein
MMNRGLGSIMGYRGGGMPIARFQEGGFTDAQVKQYLDSKPGISEAQIAQVMRETGVSPEQVARVTQADPGYVSSLTPAGIAALAPSANVSSPANVFSPADYGPPSQPSAAPPTLPAEIQRMQAQRAEAELLRLREQKDRLLTLDYSLLLIPVDQQAGSLLNAVLRCN